MRAPALRFNHTRHPTVNNSPRNIDRGNLKQPCCRYRLAGIQMSVDKLREVALGNVKATIARSRALFPGHASRGREQPKQPNAPHPRHTPALAPSLRALDGGPSSCVYEWVLEPVFLVDCEVRGMSSVLADQVVGAVCVLAELAGRRGSKRSGIFLGVFSVGDNFSWGI